MIVNRPSSTLGINTIRIQELLLVMYLTETSLASCCFPGGKISSKGTKYTFDNLSLHLDDVKDSCDRFKILWSELGQRQNEIVYFFHRTPSWPSLNLA